MSFLRYGAVPTESVVPNDGKQALLVLGKHRLLIADLETGKTKTRLTFRNAFDVSVEYLEKNGLKVGREQDYIWENLRVYSAKTGALIKDYSQSPLASEGIISCMTDSGKVAAYSRDGTFYLADPFAEVLEGEAAIYYSALPDTETGAVARRLFLERGVEIFWGAMHCDISPFCSYDYVPAIDGGGTLGAVRKIESFINSLPEGMISELLMNDMTRLRFYLLDELSYAGVRYSGYTSEIRQLHEHNGKHRLERFGRLGHDSPRVLPRPALPPRGDRAALRDSRAELLVLSHARAGERALLRGALRGPVVFALRQDLYRRGRRGRRQRLVRSNQDSSNIFITHVCAVTHNIKLCFYILVLILLLILILILTLTLTLNLTLNLNLTLILVTTTGRLFLHQAFLCFLPLRVQMRFYQNKYRFFITCEILWQVFIYSIVDDCV